MPSAPSNSISEGRADTKRVGGICNAIHEAQQNKKVLMLRFVKEKGHLSHDPVYATAMNIDIEPSTVISLDSFIAANGLLLPRQCLHIATTLATSLVQFNATKWLNRVWTKRAIHFFDHSTLSPIIDAEQPLIVHTFSSTTGNPIASSADVKPKDALLELGILLLEMWKSKTFETWAQETGNVCSAEYYPRMIAAIRWCDETYRTLPIAIGEVVQLCVTYTFEGRPDTWDYPGFRRAICEKIIEPLQDSCNTWPR